MITRALKTNQKDFLYCVWAFNKNIELKHGVVLDERGIEETESDEEILNK